MEQLDDPFYLYVHQKLQECCPVGEELSYKDARIKLSRMRLPRGLIYLILRSMEEKNLIVRVNKFTLRVNGGIKCKEVFQLWDCSEEGIKA